MRTILFLDLFAINLSEITLGQAFFSLAVVITLVTAGIFLSTNIDKLFRFNYEKRKTKDELLKRLDKIETYITKVNSLHNDICDIKLTVERNYAETKDVDCVILRDRIIQACTHHLRAGWISAVDKENLDEMFKRYKARNGNGLCHALYDKIKDLPIHTD